MMREGREHDAAVMTLSISNKCFTPCFSITPTMFHVSASQLLEEWVQQQAEEVKQKKQKAVEHHQRTGRWV